MSTFGSCPSRKNKKKLKSKIFGKKIENFLKKNSARELSLLLGEEGETLF